MGLLRPTLILCIMMLGNTLAGQTDGTKSTWKKYGDLFVQSLLTGGSFGMGFGGYSETELYPLSGHIVRHGLGCVVGCSGVLCGSKLMAKVDKIMDSLHDQTTQSIPKKAVVLWALGHALGFLVGKGLTKLLFMYGSQVELDWDEILEDIIFQGTFRLINGNSSFPPPVAFHKPKKKVGRYKKRISGPVGVSIADVCSLPPKDRGK